MCISCGTTNPNIQYAAGHFRTTKAAGNLRFNEDNVHTQCNYRCNSVLAGNIAANTTIAAIGITANNIAPPDSMENHSNDSNDVAHKTLVIECRLHL